MKGVILAAGYGTRFLPVTKTIPKEMLPLIMKPAIDFIIEEFLASGIEDILVITSRRKKALEDYLDREMEMEYIFEKENAGDKLKTISPPEARFYFIRQQEMLGTGHALMLARPFIGNEPFIVAYPDDLLLGRKPLSVQLIETYEQTGCTVLATIYDPPDIERYGTIAIAADNLHVIGIVEKAPRAEAPSLETSIGRFLYTPEIFDYLEKGWQEHQGGEYFHTAAVRALAEDGRVVYKRIEGKRLDTGAPEGFLEALLEYASTIPELRAVIRNFRLENDLT